VALDEVRCGGGGRVAAGGAVLPASVDALEAMLAHQAGDPVAADMDVQPEPQLSLDARRAVGSAAAGVDLADLFAEIGIGQGPLGRWPGGPGVIASACHTQHATQSGDLVVWLLRLDQPIAAHR
jgi:hypothetical protein